MGYDDLWRVAALAGAGAVGTLARYGLSGLVHEALKWMGRAEAAFPWGTLAVNALGCFLCGVVAALFDDRIISANQRLVLLIGFMGAFTTFSTFALETGRMLEAHQWGYAVTNLVVQNVLGLLLLFAGFALVRWAQG